MRLLLLPLLLACALGQPIPVTDAGRLDLKNVQATATSYKGKPGLKLMGAEDGFAIVKNLIFHNGTIEVDVSGAPSATAGGGARGFIGVAFHVQSGGSRYELFYIRPTNGRAPDQLRRNHTTQFISAPDWPWERLRKESPGVYESYTDVVPGEWTHLKIVVQGKDASLYVGETASQPCLVVSDLKLGDASGAIGLWIGPGTEGYFRNVVIKQ